jgi:hypothetical protein
VLGWWSAGPDTVGWWIVLTNLDRQDEHVIDLSWDYVQPGDQSNVTLAIDGGSRGVDSLNVAV